MPAPEAAIAHHARQRAILNSITGRVLSLWSTLDPADIDASWNDGRVGVQMFVTVSLGQQASATTADSYLDAVLAEQGIGIDRSASIAPRAFAGAASDGRDLETLLYEPVIAAKALIAAGTAPERALIQAQSNVVRIVSTQVQDAGRTAVGSGIIARPHADGWVRQLTPPSCSRCVVLAGKFYRHNEGFNRHPGDDCVSVPTSESIAGDIVTDPHAYFDSLSEADQDKYFTAAGAQAIREGADIGQVVNARLGMYQANDGQKFTTTGTSKRSLAGKRAPGERRPMPETLMAQAGGDRALNLELLRKFGYLV